MNAEQATESRPFGGAQGRRVKKRYSAEDRERLMEEQAASGMTAREFCEQQGILITTFHGWKKQQRKAYQAKPKLAEVEVTAQAAPIELELPGGLRIGVRLNGESAELAKLIRGIIRC